VAGNARRSAELLSSVTTLMLSRSAGFLARRIADFQSAGPTNANRNCV